MAVCRRNPLSPLSAAVRRVLCPHAAHARPLLASSLALGALAAHATVFTVTTAADFGSSGLSLRQAVAQANGDAGSVVQFDPALIGSTITLTSGEIAITTPMRIQGPGSGKLTISGNDNSRVFDIIGVRNVPSAVVISGLSLTHGHSPASGGAVIASDVALTLEDTTIRASQATNCGALFAQRSSTSLSHVRLTDNVATSDFGALCLEGYQNTACTIEDSIISGNRAFSGGGGDIGQHATVAISRTVVSGNIAAAGIGGLSVRRLGVPRTQFNLSYSTIADNAAGSGDAGGLLLQGVYSIIASTVVSGNTAASAGGILLGDQAGAGYPAVSSLALYASTIAGNGADAFGGGIEARNANQLSVRESLISGNAVSAPSGGGGGIALRGALTDVLIADSTLYGNYAYLHGGALGIFDSTAGSHTRLLFDTIARNTAYDNSSGIFGAGTPTLNSCVVANNASHVSSQDMAGAFAVNFSLIKTPGDATFSGGGNTFGLDPALGALAVNGGPTRSMLPAPTSPAVNAADPAFATGRDQRGLARVSGGRADIGAVERHAPEDIIFRGTFDP